MDRGRSRKVVRMDQGKIYDAMESRPPSQTAVEAFNRPAYKSISVLEYITKKYGIGGDAGGDDKTEAEAVQGASEGAGAE